MDWPDVGFPYCVPTGRRLYRGCLVSTNIMSLRDMQQVIRKYWDMNQRMMGCDMNKRMMGLVVVLVILCSAGCSKNARVSGKVTFPDGSPLTVGIVTFETETYVATGPLKEDGTYTIGSLSDRDGLPRGSYKVYIAGAMQPAGTQNMNVPTASATGGQGMMTMAMPMFVPAVAPKYTKADSSGITCEVKKSMTFDFRVEPPQ